MLANKLDALKRHSSLLYVVGLMGIVVFGSVRTLSLFDRSLSIDEPWSANLVHLPLSGMQFIFQNATSQPLYYLVLKIWVLIFGESETALRMPSLILFIATIVTVSLTSRYLFSPFAGLVSAFLLSISDLAMNIAATARQYFLLGFLVALTTLIAFYWLRLRPSDLSVLPRQAAGKRELGLWGAFIILCTLGLLTHPLFGFFLIAWTAATVFVSRRAVFLSATGVACSVGLYFLLWGPYFLAALKLPATAWMTVPGWKDLFEGFQNLWGQSLVVTLAVCLGLVGLAFQWRKAGHLVLSRAGKILLTLVALPTLLPFAYSQWHPVYISTRTPIIFLPALCVLVSALADLFKRRWIPVIVMLALAVNAASSAYALFVSPDPVPARTSIGYVVEQAHCGDLVIATGLSYSEVNYYFRRLLAPNCLQIKAYPEEVELHPGWLDDATVLRRPEAQSRLEAEAQALRELAPQSPGRTWVFYGASTVLTKVLRQELDTYLQPGQELPVRGSFFNRILTYSGYKPGK